MIYLKRANSEGVCWCSCEDALVSPPGLGQEACPWCGCGWLFACILCRKSFTFARAVEVDLTPDAICALDRLHFEDVTLTSNFHVAVQELKRRQRLTAVDDLARYNLQVGEEYVYLDGCVLPAVPGVVEIEGLRRRHLIEPPQVTYRTQPNRIGKVLSRAYWEGRA
jgi:hypothetical protein